MQQGFQIGAQGDLLLQRLTSSDDGEEFIFNL
jgi:hypothetical protein